MFLDFSLAEHSYFELMAPSMDFAQVKEEPKKWETWSKTRTPCHQRASKLPSRHRHRTPLYGWRPR